MCLLCVNCSAVGCQRFATDGAAEVNAIKRKANGIAAKYSKLIEPRELQRMYDELKSIGVTTGMITGDPSAGAKTCEWYINGQEVTTSRFVYSVYKPQSGNKYEYNIYFS